MCFRDDSVLLIRRGQPPLQGAWSLPGGRIEWGERVEAAAARELFEETGIQARLLGMVEVVDGLFPIGGEEVSAHYLLIDYAAQWISGEPVAGDDAAEAAFHPLDRLGPLDLWSETVRIIEQAWARFGQFESRA